MKCRHARKMLADYVNGVLGSEDIHLIQEHVAECDSCRRELDALRKVLRLTDDVKVEYPPESVWERFFPDLHRRIESEAVHAFRKQQRQHLYLLPGWAASITVVVMILFAFVVLKYYPDNSVQVQRAGNIETMESSSSPVVEDSSEPTLVIGIISRVLITEEEAAELRKLKDFIQSEMVMPSYYNYDDYDSVPADMSGDASDVEDEGEVIQFLLENGFEEFDESPMIESDGGEFGTM